MNFCSCSLKIVYWLYDCVNKDVFIRYSQQKIYVLISDAHEWVNEIPTVPDYYLANLQPRERAWHKQRGKKTLKAKKMGSTERTKCHLIHFVCCSLVKRAFCCALCNRNWTSEVNLFKCKQLFGEITWYGGGLDDKVNPVVSYFFNSHCNAR